VILYRPRGAPLPELDAGRRQEISQLAVEVLDTDELLVVAAPGVSWAKPGDGWLVTQTGCVHREAFDRHVAPHLEVHVEAEASTPDTLRRLARQGTGRALLPALAVAEDLAEGALTVEAAPPTAAGWYDRPPPEPPPDDDESLTALSLLERILGARPIPA